eukprot:TRINITY_DN1297_c0_g1_i1.p1 TRINITY_DN1297_c0_g1~~TRINITY_DN1297_c0_g1_i1.p1  ORF type:complete len:374 (+),score=80.72 TRINITY_DN1297_c0_g1_i1:427-1548(+)
MALPLGKITIVIGAGIVGSVLSNEGRISKVSDFLSGAFKVIAKHLKEDESPKENSETKTLMEQVRTLRDDLHMAIAGQSSITILNGGSQSGATTYVMPVIVLGVAGYGYVWWKGWKISDMMFVTKRSFSDACNSLGKQFDLVSTSIAAAKRQLLGKIDHVDKSIDECSELTSATKHEVEHLRGDFSKLGNDIESVQRVVHGLEFKIGQLEGKQDFTNQGVYHLCQFVHSLEKNKVAEPNKISAMSKQAIEYKSSPNQDSSQQALMLPSSSSSSPKPIKSAEPVSISCSSSKGEPSISVSPKQRNAPLSSVSGLKVISDAMQSSSQNGNGMKILNNRGNSINSNKFEWKLPGLSFLQRTNNATSSSTGGAFSTS